jgi:hypothetical protein
MYGVLLFVSAGILVVLLLRKKVRKTTSSLLLTAISVLSYSGFTVYLGLFLGGRPGGWFEGKALILPFYPLGIISSMLALSALMVSTVAIRQANDNRSLVSWDHLVAFGAASMAIALFVLFTFFPIGLSVAYEIAEIRRATWQVR